MSDEQPTPETDAASRWGDMQGYEIVRADFARRLERERDGLRRQLAVVKPEAPLPQRLDGLADMMADVARAMYADDNPIARDHAVELRGAANIARTWAKGLRGEES